MISVISATDKVAIKKPMQCIRVNFLTFSLRFSAALGIVQVNLPSALACTKMCEIRGQIKKQLVDYKQLVIILLQ